MEKVSYEREAPFDEEKRKLIYLEWYDEQYITYYIGEKETKHTDKYTFRLDVERIPGGRQKHLFSGIPVIPLLNNEESQAEAEKAISLIDAYDTILSDTTSEIEQLRLAYLWVKNMGSNITDKFLERVEQTGVFPLQENGEVGFAQKVLDDAVIQNTLAEIRQNIYQFSKSIDLTKDMGGDMRVIGWQVNLLNLENSCKVTERKFIKGLREQYRMLTEFWRRFKNGVEIEYLDLEFVFNRNFPKNIADEAKTLIDLLSSVSRKTAYGLMSFIDDADKEVAAWEEEKEKNSPLVDLDEIMGEEDEEEEEEEAE
jgi:SPP1 family phage portal protein